MSTESFSAEDFAKAIKAGAKILPPPNPNLEGLHWPKLHYVKVGKVKVTAVQALQNLISPPQGSRPVSPNFSSPLAVVLEGEVFREIGGGFKPGELHTFHGNHQNMPKSLLHRYTKEKAEEGKKFYTQVPAEPKQAIHDLTKLDFSELEAQALQSDLEYFKSQFCKAVGAPMETVYGTPPLMASHATLKQLQAFERALFHHRLFSNVPTEFLVPYSSAELQIQRHRLAVFKLRKRGLLE
jgi:hypothetical protein